MKKLCVSVLILCLAAVAFAGGQKSPGGGATFQFWNAWVGPDGNTLTDLVDEFNATNPWNITCEMTISSSTDQKLATSLPAGEGPALILGGADNRTTYGEWMQPVNDIWEITGLKKTDFLEGYMATMYKGNDLVGIPFQSGAHFLYYNIDLLKKAGYANPPRNFDEWTTMAAKITDQANHIFGSGLFKSYGGHQMRLLYKKGGTPILDAGNKKYRVNIQNNQGYKEYFAWVKNLYDKGYNPLEDDIDSMFKAGQIGIMTNGGWLAAGALEAEINFGMGKIFGDEPMGDAPSAFQFLTGTSEQILAAKRFVGWWFKGNEGTPLSKTGAGRWSLEIGFPAFYLPLTTDPAYNQNTRLQAITGKDPNAILLDTAPADFIGSGEIATALGNACQSIIYGTPIDEALRLAQQDAEAVVIKYYGQAGLAK
jgi:multiple sugar transport system substrate-binding protein